MSYAFSQLILKTIFVGTMNLKLIKQGLEQAPATMAEQELQLFCQQNKLTITLEWISGQYWWHSDLPGERPIGIEIDRELARHELFFRKSSLQKELLARAVGVKGPYRPRVWDLTAGLLGDSLLLLSFGCEVLALERHPVVAFLISSALSNASHPALARFSFRSKDALDYLRSPEKPPEVIYYDPMFEDANDKASPRKEMRIFRNFVGSDSDGTEVMAAALKLSPKRLVIKRPRLSAPLTQTAAIQYTGKSTRYDVYLGQTTRPFDSNPLE